jgi:outer membrane protein assembly factor BamB
MESDLKLNDGGVIVLEGDYCEVRAHDLMRVVRRVAMTKLAASTVMVVALASGCSSVSVLTQHNTPWRTGANNVEKTLTVSNVNAATFGLLSTWPVVGQIVAQPLYAGGKVFVATEANMVYAFDAINPSSTAPLWTTGPLGPPVLRSDLNNFVGEQCGIRTNKQQGITATPVIDLSTNTLYAEAKIERNPQSYEHRLFAIDIRNGAIRNPGGTLITATVPDRSGNRVTMDPARQLSRPGLLLSKGVVYLGFGAINCDTPHKGWVLGYDATSLAQVAAFCTMPNPQPSSENPCNSNRDGAGIWQAGNGLVGDDDGNIYFMVGNGHVTTGAHPNNVGNSFVKLTPATPGQATADGVGLSVTAVYTPANWLQLMTHDLDVGSAGPVLLEGFGLLVGGGKQGVFYVLDKNLQPSLTNQPFQATQVFGFPTPTIPPGCLEVNGLPHIHGSPVFWQSTQGTFVYVMGEKDRLRSFRLDPKTRTLSTTALVSPVGAPGPSQGCTECMPGGILSISADAYDPATGIVWASVPTQGNAEFTNQPGILHAVNAVTLQPLWNNAGETPPYFFAKFTPPTIADGKVFLAGIDGTDNPNVGDNANPTKGIVLVYGLRMP